MNETKQVKRWVILWRERTTEKWKVHYRLYVKKGDAIAEVGGHSGYPYSHNRRKGLRRIVPVYVEVT